MNTSKKILLILLLLIIKNYIYASKTEQSNKLKKVYLTENLINKENILTQSMLNQSNCIYIIQHDYNLNNADIKIPNGSILKFEGGCLKNGSLSSTDLIKISSEQYRIFWNITLNNEIEGIVYSSWFGTNEKNDDNSTYINEAIKYASEKVIITTHNIPIKISNPIIIDKKIDLEFGGIISINKEMEYAINIKSEVTRKGCIINKLYLECNNLADTGIIISAGNRHIGNNITIKGFKKYGIFAQKNGLIEPRIDFNNVIIDNSLNLKNCTGIFFDICDSTISNVEIRNCTIGIDVYGGHSIFTNIHAWIIKDSLFPHSCLVRENSFIPNKYISCTADTLQHLVIITRDWVIADFTSPHYYINYSGSIDESLITKHTPLIIRKTTNAIINITNLSFDHNKRFKILEDSEYNPKDNVSIETIPKYGNTTTINQYYNEKIHHGNIVYNTDEKRWKIFKDKKFFNISTDNGFQPFHLSSKNQTPLIIHLGNVNKWENYTGIVLISIKGEYIINIYISAFANNNGLQTKVKAYKDNFSNFEKYIKVLTLDNNIYLYLKHDAVVLLASSRHATEIDSNKFNISNYNNVNIENFHSIYTNTSFPTNVPIETGSLYFDEETSYLRIYNGNTWIPFQTINYGEKINRPNEAIIGYQYFDTTLNKPIWWTGKIWVDANGNEIK